MNPVVSATNNLRVGLTVLQVIFGIYAAIGLLYVVTGATLGTLVQMPNSDRFSVEGLGRFSAFVGLFIFASNISYIVLLNWVKQWQAQVGGWSNEKSLDEGQFQKLSNTLSRWISWSQWAPVLGVALFFLIFVVSGVIIGSTLGKSAGVGELWGVLTFAALLVISPFIILNGLILKSIRIWMLALTDRVLGHSGYTNLIGQSNVVSNWFVLTQVVIALIALLTLAPALTNIGSNSSNVTSFVVMLLTLALDILNFMLLQWSKTFMFGVAGYAERHGSSAVDLSKA